MTLVNPNLDCKVEKCIQDTNGRFLIFDLLIDELHLILVNIYAPNDANQQVTFFKELENQLEDFAQENIIIGGDLTGLFLKMTKEVEIQFGKIHSN